VSDPHNEVEPSGFNRRSLIKKMAVGAFAVPAIVSFELDSLARAGTFSSKPPKHMYPNQTEANQHPPKPPKDCDPPKQHDPDPKPPKQHDPDPPKPPKQDKPPHESEPPKPPKQHKPDHKSKPT
jgi:hypothetical protein